jgi:hypothetical protein
MEIPLSTILRFGICGVPELVPLEPPRIVREFQFFEVNVTYYNPVDNIKVQWGNLEEDINGIYEVSKAEEK